MILSDWFYFQLNIHRCKLIARFGLMHICATNLCVWIRTLILESLKEITLYHQRNFQAGIDNPEKGILRGNKLECHIRFMLLVRWQFNMECFRRRKHPSAHSEKCRNCLGNSFDSTWSWCNNSTSNDHPKTFRVRLSISTIYARCCQSRI